MSLYDRLRIVTAVVSWYLLNRYALIHWDKTTNKEERLLLSVVAFPVSLGTAVIAFLAYAALYWVATGVLPLLP